MAQLKPIKPEGFSDLYWISPQSYLFAETWGTIPLSYEEAFPIASAMPVGFKKKAGRYYVVAIAGQQADRNLFVGPSGKWAGSLLPQVLRIHPFQLAAINEDKFVLCADTESDCLVQPPAGQPFFSDGEISQPLATVLEALKKREGDIRGVLAKACSAIDAEGLFEPWPLQFKRESGEVVTHQGLYRVSTDKLNSLNVAELARLYQAQALPLIYAHRLSTFHLHLLDRLAKAHGLGREDVDIEELFGEEDDDFSFNF